jgi:hypothetical protein
LCQSAFGSYYSSSSQRIKRFDYTQLHALSQVWCGITCLTLRGRTRAALAMSLIKNEYSKDVNRVGPSTAIIIIQMANSHQQTDYDSSMHTAISTSSRLERVLREATRSRRSWLGELTSLAIVDTWKATLSRTSSLNSTRNLSFKNFMGSKRQARFQHG